jgi:hypothetical protein
MSYSNVREDFWEATCDLRWLTDFVREAAHLGRVYYARHQRVNRRRRNHGY